jgi:hypothetical protein
MQKLISRNVLPFGTNTKYGQCSTCQSGGSKKQKGGSIASLLQSLFPTVTVNSLMTTTGLVTVSKVVQRKTTKPKKRKTTKSKKRKTTKSKTTKPKKRKTTKPKKRKTTKK